MEQTVQDSVNMARSLGASTPTSHYVSLSLVVKATLKVIAEGPDEAVAP